MSEKRKTLDQLDRMLETLTANACIREEMAKQPYELAFGARHNFQYIVP